jgi:hypothetical protein
VFRALGTNTVGEIRAGMFADVMLYLVPVPFVIADFFAIRTNWKKAGERLHLSQEALQFDQQPFPFPFRALLFADVPRNG